MDSRIRTFRALGREPVDRIPIDFWASDAMIRRIEVETGLPYGAFLDRHDIDLRYIPGPRYIGPPLGEGCDIWGVRRRAVSVPTPYGEERYSEVAESPLAGLETPEEIAAYTGWPSADAFDYSVIPDQCRPLREAGRVVCFMGDRLNRVAQLKPAMYLRGMEAILMDLTLRPDLAEAIIGHIRAFYTAYLDRVLEAAGGLTTIQILILALGIIAIPLLARITRATSLTWSQREFVTAARAQGAKDLRIMIREVLPNALPAMFSIALLSVGIAIIGEGALSVLGMGVEPPAPSWGNMIAENRSVSRAPLNALFCPVIALFLTVMALNYLGDAIRARFDVRESSL